MKNRLQHIVQNALDVFRKATGFAVEYQTGYIDDVKYPDGLIRIAQQNMEWHFAVEVKARVARETAGMKTLDRFYREEKVLLITEYVTPPVADLLKELNIFFIDTAGNAYINEPPLYVFIKGNRPPFGQKAEPRKRLFKPGGLKVVFALLNNPDMVNKPYRDIAQAADVALGTVGWVFRDLKEMGFYLKMGKGRRMLMNLEKLFKRWVEGYPEQLRPKLTRGRFEATDHNWWREINITAYGGFWGGEVAAANLTGYLKPAKVTIYTDEPLGKLVLKNGLRKAGNGNIEILAPFWNFKHELVDRGFVPPLLVYADLMATGDPRNIEAAGMIYDKYIAGFVREN